MNGLNFSYICKEFVSNRDIEERILNLRILTFFTKMTLTILKKLPPFFMKINRWLWALILSVLILKRIPF